MSDDTPMAPKYTGSPQNSASPVFLRTNGAESSVDEIINEVGEHILPFTLAVGAINALVEEITRVKAEIALSLQEIRQERVNTLNAILIAKNQALSEIARAKAGDPTDRRADHNGGGRITSWNG